MSANLTERQRCILSKWAFGMSTKQVASECGLSPKTVEYHLDAAKRRLNIHSLQQIVRYAVFTGLIPNEMPNHEQHH